jgi:very-short-patch-repair endonuclease
LKKYDCETAPEELLRKALEAEGFKKDTDFLIQHPTRLGFILDFYFPKHNLAVEVDGIHWHKPNNKKDRFRDYMHKRKGIKTIRITDEQIYDDINGCMNKIRKELMLTLCEARGLLRQDMAEQGPASLG